MTELEFGKYEFFPYEDDLIKIRKDLEQSKLTDEEIEHRLKEMLEELQKSKKKRGKK